MDLLSHESAREIEEWIERQGGYIERTQKRNIRVCNIGFYTTTVLKDWLDTGAHVFFSRGLLNISNWPEKRRRFEVEMEGPVTRETLEDIIIEGMGNGYVDIDIVNVKEMI